VGRLGRRVSGRAKGPRGGSSFVGEYPNRGETENAVPLSETSDGAPSIDSALEASDTEGDGSGGSLARRGGNVDEIVSGRFSAGRANDSD
jgi:hypothetical protein